MLIQRGKAATFLVAVGFLCGFCLPKHAFEIRAMRFGEACTPRERAPAPAAAVAERAGRGRSAAPAIG